MDEDYEVEEPQPVPELVSLFKSRALARDLLNPRLFYLQRDTDISGISGTGCVADGVLWPDGSCAVRWRSERASVSVWSSYEDMVAIHGHGGATRIIFLDGA